MKKIKKRFTYDYVELPLGRGRRKPRLSEPSLEQLATIEHGFRQTAWSIGRFLISKDGGAAARYFAKQLGIEPDLLRAMAVAVIAYHGVEDAALRRVLVDHIRLYMSDFIDKKLRSESKKRSRTSPSKSVIRRRAARRA